MNTIFINNINNDIKEAINYFLNNYFNPAELYSIHHLTITKDDNQSGFFYIENDLYTIYLNYYIDKYIIEKINNIT